MSKRALLFGAAAIGLAFAGGFAVAQTGVGPRHMMGMHGSPGRGMGPGALPSRDGERGSGPAMGMMDRGMHGMPMMGLMGMHAGSATSSEHADIRDLFADHQKIRRSVTNLPDGIRTLTESEDPQVANAIKDHVKSMGDRVEQGRDPGLPIETDALHAIFLNKDKIKSTYEVTEKGVAVVQTSSDPQVVRDLQEHAAQVSDLAERGMMAAHEAMMANRAH